MLNIYGYFEAIFELLLQVDSEIGTSKSFCSQIADPMTAKSG